MSDWSNLIPKPSSSFLRVRCVKCGNEQLLFSHAVNVVKCSVCGEVLAEPSSGKAKLKGEVTASFE
ncbi:MAG: 30S ribosomal protein S27e [Candidatus Bathyarchaeia archaeon]